MYRKFAIHALIGFRACSPNHAPAGFRATSALEQALKISPARGIYFMKLQFGHTHTDTATAPAFNVAFGSQERKGSRRAHVFRFIPIADYGGRRSRAWCPKKFGTPASIADHTRSGGSARYRRSAGLPSTCLVKNAGKTQKFTVSSAIWSIDANCSWRTP
jgi:hypothetical protein